MHWREIRGAAGRSWRSLVDGGLQGQETLKGRAEKVKIEQSMCNESEGCCCVGLFMTPWPIQSMEFSRAEYWSE